MSIQVNTTTLPGKIHASQIDGLSDTYVTKDEIDDSEEVIAAALTDLKENSGNRTWICRQGTRILGKKLTSDTSIVSGKYYYTPNTTYSSATYFNLVTSPVAGSLSTYYEDDYDNPISATQSTDSDKTRWDARYEYVRLLCIEGVTDNFTLKKGDIFIIKIEQRNLRGNTRFVFGNENGTIVLTTDPIPIWWANSQREDYSAYFNNADSGYYYTYAYDGTYLRWINYYQENDTSNVLAAYFGLQRTAKNIIRQYKLVAYQGSSYVVGLSTAQPSSVTEVSDRDMTTESFDVFNHILYKYSSGNITDGASSAGAGFNYFQVNVDLRWTFNLAGYVPAGTSFVELSPGLPLYLVCVPQNDGQVKLDATAPLAQTLPSSETGKVYKYLGECANSTYNSGTYNGKGHVLNLSLDQPVYYYKDGQIREWTNASESGGSGGGGSGIPYLYIAENSGEVSIDYGDTTYETYEDLLDLCTILQGTNTDLCAIYFRNRIILGYVTISNNGTVKSIVIQSAEGDDFSVSSDTPSNPDPGDSLVATVNNLIASNAELETTIGNIDFVLDQILGVNNVESVLDGINGEVI